MDHETEVIKENMRETRTALTEKLEALEEKVVSTVKETTEAVEETVGSVREAVQDTVHTVQDTVNETVDTVKETVKETFDLHHQMAEHPWLMLGGATLVGYLGGCLLGGTNGTRSSSKGWQPLEGHGGRPEERFRAPEPARAEAARTESPLWDKVSEVFAPAVSKLESMAIGAAAGVIGKMILNAAPEALRGDLEGVINDLTTSLGGKPRPDLLHEENQSAPTTQGAQL
jgi:ElaB/YqjD/DUF883 family membrane-anchored ribosome-binding protein